jgi:hypothetical protein
VVMRFGEGVKEGVRDAREGEVEGVRVAPPLGAALFCGGEREAVGVPAAAASPPGPWGVEEGV